MALMLAQGTVGGLADDLDVMDDSIHRFPIAGESLVVETLDVRCDAIDRLLDILEPKPPIPRRHELPL